MSRMLDIRERARLRRFLYAKPTILLLLIVVAFLMRGAWAMYEKSREAELKRERVVAELNELKDRKGELDADIARLSTPEGVEEAIRERFMVAKEGEKVMIISDPDAQKVHTVTISEDEPTFFGKIMSSVGYSGE